MDDGGKNRVNCMDGWQFYIYRTLKFCSNLNISEGLLKESPIPMERVAKRRNRLRLSIFKTTIL